jgi:hypothetical protein
VIRTRHRCPKIFPIFHGTNQRQLLSDNLALKNPSNNDFTHGQLKIAMINLSSAAQ